MNKTIEQIDKEIYEDQLFDEYLEYSGANQEHEDAVNESRRMSPEGIDFVAKKRELRLEIDKIKYHLDKLRRNNKVDNYFVNILDKYIYVKELSDLEKQYKRFDFYNKKYNLKKDVLSYDLDMIKETILIGDLLGTPKETYSQRCKYLCPFHTEKTPSFIWFKKENTAHCFGCGFHGSVLDVYMKLNNCDFKEAIKDLNKML